MEKKKVEKIILILVLAVIIILVALIPSGLLGDFWAGITGNVISEGRISGKVVSESNLIAHYKFENNVKDSAGNNNGRKTGGSFGLGKIGNALIVDGVDDSVSIAGLDGTMFNGEDSFTLAAWYKATSNNFSFPDGQQAYFFGGTLNNYGLWANNLSETLELGHSYWAKTSEGAYERISDSKGIELNEWYHVFSTYNSVDKEICYYIGGKVITCKDVSLYGELSLADASRSQFNIGGPSIGFSLPAEIDEAKIWNYALSVEEIKEEYDSYFIIEVEEDTEEETEEEIEEETIEQEEVEEETAKTDSELEGISINYWLVLIILVLVAVILYLISKKGEGIVKKKGFKN